MQLKAKHRGVLSLFLALLLQKCKALEDLFLIVRIASLKRADKVETWRILIRIVFVIHEFLCLVGCIFYKILLHGGNVVYNSSSVLGCIVPPPSFPSKGLRHTTFLIAL